MKRKLLFIIATVFLVAACHNDDYMPGLPAPGNEDNETEMSLVAAGNLAIPSYLWSKDARDMISGISSTAT